MGDSSYLSAIDGSTVTNGYTISNTGNLIFSIIFILLEIGLLTGAFFLIIKNKKISKGKKIFYSILSVVLGNVLLFLVSSPIVILLNWIQQAMLKA